MYIPIIISLQYLYIYIAYYDHCLLVLGVLAMYGTMTLAQTVYLLLASKQ